MARDPEQLGEALGSTPHIPVLLQPFDASGGSGEPAASFAVTLGRKTAVSEVHDLLCARLGAPVAAVTLMYEGRDLAVAMSLEENEVHLPGPAARRAGERVKLLFAVDRNIVGEVQAAATKARDKARDQVLSAELAERQVVEKARQDEWWRGGGAEQELDDFIEARLGRSRVRVEELCAVDAEFERPRHFLEPCEEAQRVAVQSLMSRTWQGGASPWQRGSRSGSSGSSDSLCVVRLFRVENTVLRDRQVRARELLRSGATITRRTTATGSLVAGSDNMCLGAFDASVNEFPLWHGTPTPEAAHGICSTGFDIAYAGASVGSAFAPGFYFAANSNVSHAYAKSPWMVNSRFRAMHVMLLCRVLCGNLRETQNPPNEEEKERLTAMCLGPGGSFGAGSEFHAVLGGGWAYVAMHRDQVIPEFVAVYTTDPDSSRDSSRLAGAGAKQKP